MLHWDPPVFNSPFELHREQGLLRLVFAPGARIGTAEMKELLRLSAALDPLGESPLLVECGQGLVVDEAARRMLCRVCDRPDHAIALHTTDLDLRLQAEVFRQVHCPGFALRVFAAQPQAYRWLRERQQHATLLRPATVEKGGDILPVLRS